MADGASLTGEDRIGIGIAVVAHVALAVALAWHATREPPQLAPPERIEVSLANEVSLVSTAPDPSAQPAASTAPQLSEVPTPPAPEPPTARPVEPRPQPTTPPPPPRRATERSTPAPAPTPRATRTPTPAPRPTAAPTQRSGGSRLSENFLDGASNASGTRGQAAATFGSAERASLTSAITRELRPHWSVPQGVDADQLVSVVAWRLNQNGSLNGTPRCVTQRGITDANRAQAAVHCERAIRAVQLAAPFSTLPPQFYTHWDDLEWEFDRRL